jgi:hypothetical protein
MQNNVASMLGMRLNDVTESSLVRWLDEPSKTELIEDRFYMEMPASGIVFIAGLDGRVATIQLYAEGYQDYKGFAGELPEGISFTDDRRGIRARLGQPAASGGGTVIQFFGKAPSWDRFDRDSYSLHIQYVEGDGSINLVSLLRPDSIPK